MIYKKSSVLKVFGQIIPCVAVVLLLCLNPNNSLSRQNLSKLKISHTLKTAAPADSLDKQTGLIIAPGYVLVKQNCVRCHSPKIITDKRATREGWLATIRWMQQTQGLWDLGKAEPKILDYLAAHYAPTNEGRRPSLKNIQWYKLE